MAAERFVVDYALVRKSVLADLFAGRVSAVDVCDAHPYLLRAARYHGEPGSATCPVCRREPLTNVTYVYGDELRSASGRPRSTAEVAALARVHRDLHVYVVEVCRGCSWNHLMTSYVTGRTRPVRTRRAAQVAEPSSAGADAGH
ncbi:MAG: DUF5318 family protein [Mycobacteriales bacterium]